MAFPKHHGITLAANSFIENLLVEKLAADPMPIVASRIWHNTTERSLKFSLLNASGAVIVRTVANLEDLQAALATLQAAVDAEATARIAGDSAEVAARVAALATVTQAVADETAARIAGDAAEVTARTAGDASEASARTAAIAVAAANAADATATETAARLAGDVAMGVRVDGVQAELDATQAGAGLSVTGAYVAPANTTYLGTATSLNAADALLDTALAAEAATRAGQFAGLASAAANEAQLRTDGDANLQAQLTAYIDSAVTNNVNADNAETVARVAADSALQAELDRTQATIGTDTNGNLIPITGTNYLNAVTTVFGGAFVLDAQIKVVSDALAAEAVARVAADNAFTTALNAEIAARTAGGVAVQEELDRVEAGAGLETDGSYAAPTGSNYLDAATSLKNADLVLDSAAKAISNRVGVIETTTIPALQSQITAEVARATAAEAAAATAASTAADTSSAAVAAERTRALAAEAALATSVSDEATARTAALASVSAAVTAEATRAQAAESSNASSIAGEVSRAQAAEAALGSQITAIQAASGEGAAALKTTLNTGRYNFKSAVAALTHVITHNLNSEFYTLQVMVQGADGVYRNDIVPVEETDALNSLTITLTEARKVKVSVVSNAPLV